MLTKLFQRFVIHTSVVYIWSVSLSAHFQRLTYWYQLRHNGIEINEEATLTDLELLEDIMASRELIEELRDPNLPGRTDQIDALSRVTQSRVEKLVSQIESAFVAHQHDECRDRLHQLSYVVKILRELSQLP